MCVIACVDVIRTSRGRKAEKVGVYETDPPVMATSLDSWWGHKAYVDTSDGKGCMWRR
jgi:hypothetical protein